MFDVDIVDEIGFNIEDYRIYDNPNDSGRKLYGLFYNGVLLDFWLDCGSIALSRWIRFHYPNLHGICVVEKVLADHNSYGEYGFVKNNKLITDAFLHTFPSGAYSWLNLNCPELLYFDLTMVRFRNRVD